MYNTLNIFPPLFISDIITSNGLLQKMAKQPFFIVVPFHPKSMDKNIDRFTTRKKERNASSNKQQQVQKVLDEGCLR